MAGDETRAIYAHAQLGHRLGYGERPAVIVVDLQVGFTDPERSLLAGDLTEVVQASNRVIAAARKAGAPLVYTVVAYDPNRPEDAGLWVEKAPSLRSLALGGDLAELDPRLDHQPTDLVMVKKYASSFCGTHLASILTARRVDTAIILGCTTSGCVRATVMDALFHGFRPIVPIEAVGDRAQEPHEANLFDMASKYADVVPLAEVLDYLERQKQSAPDRRTMSGSPA
jgi:nicotinamidase-related amidase